MHQRKDLEEDLEKLKMFLHDNGIKLVLTASPENYIDHYEEEIVVSSEQPLEHVLYTILHEMGHYFSETHFDSPTKVTTVIEEVLAWDRGYDIAQTLRINIDDESWNSLMLESIRQYMEEQ